jgi:hypothetical protein
MTRYKWPLIIGAGVLLLLISMKVPPAGICLVLAIGCLIFAGIDWARDLHSTPQSPDVRIVIGQQPAARMPEPEAPAPQTWQPPPTPAPMWQGVKQWVPQAKAFLDRMAGLITTTLHDLSSKKFGEPDPILTAEQSHAVSLAHSAIIRHGHVIETSLREALKDCARYDVWEEHDFEISHQADGAFKTLTEAQCRQTDLAYRDGVPIRKVQVDLIIFDRQANVIRAYEVKRGYGGLSAGTQAEVSRDVHTVCMLLKSYAATRGYNPQGAEAHLVAYYGEGWSKRIGGFLKREDLDKHFGFPVVAQIEASTARFKAGLQEILAPQYRGNDRRAA